MTIPVAATYGRRSKRPAIAAAVILVVALGWLIWGGLDKNVVFFLEPHELLAAGPKEIGVAVRLGGLVKNGSVAWNDTTRDLRFDVTDTTGVVVHVKASGTPPQMFRDAMGVIVEGRLVTDSVFAATSLMIKHSNEYRAPKAGERPRDVYKSLLQDPGK